MAAKYKPVKNAQKPGRPPSGCVWVKDDSGNLKTNAKGEVGYRPATAADLAAKKAKAAKMKPGRKPGRGPGRPRKVATADAPSNALLLSKRTYNDLSYSELQTIAEIVAGKLASKKATEQDRIQKEIAALKGQLSNLK